MTQGYGLLYIPGSVLLLGEYAILGKANIGLACAVRPSTKITVSYATSLQSCGIFADKSHANPPLAIACMDAVRDYLGEKKITGSVIVDSSNLYNKTRKRGLGSSAAAVLGYIAGLFLLHGYSPFAHRNDIYKLGVKTHRLFQNGGSGYDVATSLFGGVGKFISDNLPKWEPQTVFWGVSLVDGETSCQSKSAIQTCRDWKATHSKEWNTFTQKSNSLITKFLCAHNWTRIKQVFQSAKKLYQNFGKDIGIHANWQTEGLFKPVGAGTELGVRITEIHESATQKTGIQWFPA